MYTAVHMYCFLTTVVCLGHSLETVRSKEKNWFVVCVEILVSSYSFVFFSVTES